MVDADHYSWEEVYSLLGCDAELEPDALHIED